jgi:catechol 2,3-dioxygenase-like lactoylglutathione lyase family enzyme
MRLSHINLVARDAVALADFYRVVFELDVLRELTMLSGEKVSRGNGVSNSVIKSIWLKLPGANAPFLEIHEHETTHDRGQPKVSEPGFGHLSFEIGDISATLANLIAAGGSQVGQITDFGSVTKPRLIVYARDPEGNILELEQP